MYINADQLNKLDNELLDVARALVKGETIHLFCEYEKDWFTTERINMELPRSSYHIGETAPE